MLRPASDDPDRFVEGAGFATDSADHPLLTVQRVQQHNDGLLITFDGVDDRNQAEQLRGVSVFIGSERRRELGNDEYWPDDLVGLRVVDTSGSDMGTVSSIIRGSPQDRLEIAGIDGAFEVPFVAALVPVVDVAAGRVVVDLPEGLSDSG